ncbi:MAG: GNAT family N-acetyltransferase [Candidatus Aminicenantes bacterium]|nr:GNAT family N-acetyltransferase [Candidatus Aminicenantes bacterium]NIM81767.1 GNAT family N-acetyltransferase [Candidatus Aminicenantes bacterium]NIN21139.1 GNAT family N-acetyltransferase [Candidatus Aminicenantes bacterium]NIN44961.1 GNAT family N-acetyltransferase [Candidatus Aminicenantes bacterium]NIN87775.1 GNAT family N-acetyltransferase [Candidatus Aminicenantes bacterium]
MMQDFDWKHVYSDRLSNAREAMKLIKPGNSIFIGTGCGQPQHLVNALVMHSKHIYDARIIHFLTMGAAPYASEKFRPQFRTNSFFIGDNVRDAFDKGIADYTPIFLSQIPRQFETGRIPLDVVLLSATPPDVNGLCSLGVSVDVVKSAAANAKCVIAQVNENMPRTLGNSFIHIDSIDVLVPYDEPIITVKPQPLDKNLQKAIENVARLIENGSTIECGIGQIPEALAEFLRDKKDLGIHTELVGDWLIDLIECGAVTCSKKTINHGKVVASMCMGSQRLYDYIDNNDFFEFYPSEYVNDPFIISQHDKMVSINSALEVDLTGQVCSDSLGYRFYSGIGGQVDFMRGSARSRGGKPIIALPSTAHDDTVSRIVLKLTDGAGVVTTRGDVHYVVTEYGIAYLHGKSIQQRVLSLIDIAHPKFRNQLIKGAKAQRYIHEDQIELAWEKVTYPKELEHYDTLRDGTEIFFRPVKPTDEAALSEMLYSLSISSLRKRFFTHTQTFPHKDVQRLTNLDYKNELAIVGVVPGPSGEDIVAIAQYFLDPKTQVAEVAFIVQDEWQAKGMGTFLLNYITGIAIERGIKRFYATVLPENKAMLNIFYNCGYNVNTDFDGSSYTITYDLHTTARGA